MPASSARGSCLPGGFYFLTGDIVCRRKIDRALVWLGRVGGVYICNSIVNYLRHGNYICKDNQVKIRGIRIELEEVERLISQRLDSGSTTAVAVLALNPEQVQGSESKTVRLAAIVEVKYNQKHRISFFSHPNLSQSPPPQIPIEANHEESVKELREKLLVELPTVMMPSLILPVVVLPKTDSGKINRRQLQRELVDHIADSLKENHALDDEDPRTKDSHVIDEMGVFIDLLRLLRVVIPGLSVVVTELPSQTFFTVGGDSMLAIEFIWVCKSVIFF